MQTKVYPLEVQADAAPEPLLHINSGIPGESSVCVWVHVPVFCLSTACLGVKTCVHAFYIFTTLHFLSHYICCLPRDANN